MRRTIYGFGGVNRLLACAAAAILFLRAPAVAEELIPRKVLFGNPDRAAVEISPDGKYVSFLAPRDGVMNVYVAPADDATAAKPVTDSRKRGIPNYSWAFD